MVDFGGWDMPVEYSGITPEHMAVRTAVGLFDVSHMGDIQFRGPGSLAAIQALSMNDASRLADGQAQYSAMLYPQGTFVDDVLCTNSAITTICWSSMPVRGRRIISGSGPR